MADEVKAAGSSPEEAKKAGPEGAHSPTPEEWAEAQKAIRAKSEAAERLAKKLEAYEADKARAAEEAAKKSGEFEKLYAAESEKRKALEAEVGSIRAAQQAEFEALVKGWPTDDLALIPDGLHIAEKLAFARKLAARLGQSAQSPGTAGVHGSRSTPKPNGGFASDQEWARKDWKGYKAYRDSLHRRNN
jgi:hypothetical protein